MDLFEQLKRDGYGELHVTRDGATGLHALVAIHDTSLGPALGGCRFIPYPSTQAAVDDVLRLARAMTAKAALAGVPHGGGKAVIMRPPTAPTGGERARIFEAFGRFIDSLGGRYITTEDSGTTTGDIGTMRRVTRYAAGHDDRAGGGSGDPSPFTALGVRRGIEACVNAALGRDDLDGLHVAVQGVGNVGGHLCRELASLGATLTIADVRTEVVSQLAQELQATVAPVHAIHKVACDVYAPCALGGAINHDTVEDLQCRIVAGGANNQLAEPSLGQRLQARGILYAPDYAINAGGLINVAEEVAGYDESRARERTLGIYDTIHSIAQRALAEGGLPHEIAEAMVKARLQDGAGA